MKLLAPELVHKDSRRSLSQLVTADLKQINIYATFKGELLGNHYHKETYEYFLIIKGSFEVDISGKRYVVKSQDFFVVEPLDKHTLKCLSPQGAFLTFLTRPYRMTDTDTYKE